MSVDQFETEVLNLAVRRVRTPEGAQFYGLPIGAPITADVIAAKKAEGAASGLTPPKGALTKPGGGKGQHMKGTISGKVKAEKDAPKPQAAKPLNLKVVKPTLSGNQHFSIGKSKYSAPNGSKLIRPASQPNMAYVVTPEGKVHAFNEQGEVPIPKPLDQIFAQKFGEGFEGDEEYSLEEFEAKSASHALPDLKIGATLTDAEGTPQFTKVGEGAWEHVDLGVKLKDEDLQDLYDSGDLVPDAADEDNAAAEGAFQDVEAVNFAEMSKDEAETALAGLPEGQKLTVGGTEWTKTGPDEFKNQEGKVGTSKSLAVVKAAIKIGTDVEPEYNPLDGETSNPLDENPPKLIGDTPDEAWMDAALPAAQMEFVNSAGDTTTWTKDEDGSTWTNQKGGKLTHEQMKNATKASGGEGLTIKKEGKEPKAAAGGDSGAPSKPKSTAAPAEEPENPYDKVETITLQPVKPSKPEGLPDRAVEFSKDTPPEFDTDDEVHEITPGGNHLISKKQFDGSWITTMKNGQEVPGDEAGVLDSPEGNKLYHVKAKASEKDWSLASDDELDEGLQTGKLTFKKYKEAKATQIQKKVTEILEAPEDGQQLSVNDDVVTYDAATGVWNGADSDGSFILDSESVKQANASNAVQVPPTSKPEMASAPDGPKFGEPGYFDNAPDGATVWVKGKPYTMDTSGWWGNDGILGSGEIAKLHAEGAVSDHEKPYNLTMRDLGPHATEAETLEILKNAAEGDSVHPFNSAGTLTKVNSNADQVTDYFGEDAAEQEPSGYWQSSVTGKLLPGSELAKYWTGDLVPGPSNGDMGDGESTVPAPEPEVDPLQLDKEKLQSEFVAITEKVKVIDQANSVHEMATALSAANPGEKVINLISGTTFEKTNKGTWLHTNENSSGVELTPQELASFNWNTEMQISELMHGDVLPEKPEQDDSDPLDAIADEPEFNDAADAAGEVADIEEDSDALPPGIPAGSVEVAELADLPVGATMYEYHPQNGIYTHTKTSEDTLDTTTASGFKIPNNTYGDVQEMVADPDWLGKFYHAPSPVVSANLPSDAKPWDGNWQEFDGESQSMYAASVLDGAVYEFVATDQDGEFLTYGPGEDGSFTDASDFLDMLNDGSHTFYVGAPTHFAKKAEAPAADAPAASLGWQKDDVVTSVDDLDNVPVGTKLAYLQKSGKVSYYTNLGNGLVLTPGGNQMAASKLKYTINKGNLSIHELPEGAPAPEAPQSMEEANYLFYDGDPIQTDDQLNSLNIGQKLEMQDSEGNHLNYVIKQADGSWKAPDDDPTWPGLEFTQGDMLDSMKNGLFFVSTEGVSPLTGPKLAPPTDVPETPDEPQLWPGAVGITKEQLQAALDGLEAHTSFHVAYGLKSLPETNPLAHADIQAELKNAAMEKYPDLKAKPATVKYLKDVLGIEEPNAWEKELMEAAPKIHIGSFTPKKVGVQGMDGGDYTAADIQDAINILEAYPGKLFKNELNKKGNPLGELDPTQIIGLEKDKLVAKQKYIDLLKTKLVNQEAQPKQPVIQSVEEFEGYPVGTQVGHHTSEDGSLVETYTKISENQWVVDASGGSNVIDNSAFHGSISKGNLRLYKLPDVVPDYAKTPAAVKDKEKEQNDTEDDDFSLATMQGAEVGTKMHWGDGSGNKAEKTAPDTWTIWDADGNQINTWTDEHFFNGISMSKKGGNSPGWFFSDVTEDQPKYNSNLEFAIIPGKYSTEGGESFIVVHADGSGTYYQPNGAQAKITPEQVKNNYNAGMKKYHGLVSEADLPQPPANAGKPAAKKKAAPKKPKVVGDLADGTYFAGNPNDGKTPIYEISGDTAKVYKAATGLTATTGVKIGGQPNKEWIEQAGFGASYENQATYYLGAYVGKTKWTKGQDGMWTGVKADGTLVGEPTGNPPVGWGYKVQAHGMSDPVELPKAKVNTLFSQGQLTDQYGNAVIPDGYTGSLQFFGAQTTVPALLAASKWINSPEFDQVTTSSVMQEKLKELGVNFDVHNWHKWRKDNNIAGAGFEASAEAMKKALADVTTGVDTDVPEADTASLFEWNNLGEPVMPLELLSMDVPYGKVAKGEWIKNASKFFGDGKVIGLHVGKMDEYDRNAWIAAFKEGDFAKMYSLEVTAASLEGKAHGSGYLHPGFPDNAATKKIQWAAAVEGEISALVDIDGEWTSLGLNPPADEVNNYLIKAQMQNPTYLTQTERRQWYSAHRQNQKAMVDKLSATAALRKKNGEAELTPPLKWTDDIKPAKSYDQLFEGTANPVLNWTSSMGMDYVKDHPENAELQAMWQAKKDEGYGEMAAGNSAVSAYFQKQIDAHEAELAKVFYVKTPNQKVKKGTHPIFEYDDFNGHGPLGGHYFFKPSPMGDAYRSEAEHLGHEYGWVFGFKTAGSQLIELDGKYGQLQKDLGSKSSLAQFDLSTLSANQIADIGKEHLLDWFLDNDDTHSENMQVMPDGSLVGIDKGRAFKHFGKWQGLNPDAMNSNAQTIYSKLFNTIKAGKLSKEDVDKAYLQIQKRAQQMAKVNDDKIAEMLAKGMAKRKVWDVAYKIDGKAVPNSLEGLTAAVLDRKNKLPQQMEQLWSKIYKDAGFGDLPEPPAYKLGEEHYSGLNESHFHENAFKVGAGGVSTLMGGDFSQTGSAIAWNTVNKDGSKEVYTQVELNHVADAKVYSKLQSMNPDATDGSADPTTFDKDEYGGFFSRDYYRTMATLAKHNDDKQYNADRIKEYEAAKVRLQKDLNAIQISTLPLPNKDGLIKMPSGAMVPQTQLGQYRMMLEFYQSKEAAMDATIATQADYPASNKAKFEPYPLAVKGKNYVNSGMDAQLTQLANGSYLYSDPSVAKVVEKDAVPDMISTIGGWQELAPEPEGPKSFGGATVQLVNQTFETKGTWDNDTGIISTGTAGVGSWTKGSEFKITLPTGETIYFRNRAKTNTLHSQYGRMTIKVPNATDANAYAAGIERAQDWLASYLDLDMEGADEESAELVYWKQMLPTLTRRAHKSGSKYDKANKVVEAKAAELGISTDDFPFRFGEYATVQEQNEFYRKVWGDQFGQDKIDKLVQDQAFLPKYEGTDIHNKDVVHGRPIWTRFDVSLADLLKANPNAFVASHNTSGGDAPKNVAVSGSHLSTEERIRFFGGVAGGSSSADQQMGTGGQDQFTRIWNSADASGYDYVYHPSTLLHTNTRFFHNDAFGADSSEKGYANPDPMDWIKNKTSNSGSLGGGNQLDIRWASSWLNSLEMVIFDDVAARDYAIQKLKQAGLEMIRGLPVEDRLVMRQNRAQAIAKLRAQWQKEAGL